MTTAKKCVSIILRSENPNKKGCDTLAYIFNYSKLRGKIREVFITENRFAKAMKMSAQTLSGKLNNCSRWSQDEIIMACLILGIPFEQIHDFFYVISSENPNVMMA